MIHPFVISARTVHQLETIESQESCCLKVSGMAFAQRSIADLSSQWVCRTRHLHATNWLPPKIRSFSRQWRHPIVFQSP
jgi:hypothetical protein